MCDTTLPVYADAAKMAALRHDLAFVRQAFSRRAGQTMRIFSTPPYRDVKELLDSSEQFSEREIETTLRDIRRANIFGLGRTMEDSICRIELSDCAQGVHRKCRNAAGQSAEG